MKRTLKCGALSACILAALPAGAGQQPTFRGGSDAVRVFVTVTDKDGRLATKLTRENFERSEERRVGKEGRGGWWAEGERKGREVHGGDDGGQGTRARG